MEEKKKLPIGIENFEKIRTEGFYYVDKTGLIKELLNNWGEVNLFTRPRRFGKSLNMDMLKTFFEYGCDGRLFEGLEITREQELCRKYMGNFPVISITLKGVNARSYETARGMLSSIIGEEARRDISKLDAFCDAFEKADAKTIELQFNAYLQKTISIRDTSVRKVKKENFYHGILLGLLSHREEWDIDSNAESGEGYSDILIEIAEKSIGIVIEIKYPADGDLEKGCRDALEQIEKMKYETRLRQDGMRTIFQYGIACSKKSCRVQRKMESENKKVEYENR